MTFPFSAYFTSPERNRWIGAAALVMLLYLGVILLTFRGYGMSWDQPWGHRYQVAIMRFYATHGADGEAPAHYARHYGGLFDVSASIVERATNLSWIEARDLASALYGWLGVLALLISGWMVFGPTVGVLGAIFLILTPVYYGHQFINPKDTPFAALTMFAVRYIIALVQECPRPRWSTAIKLGLAIGAAMGVRVGGLFLFGVLGIAAVGAMLMSCWIDGWRRSLIGVLILAAQACLIGPLAWGVMTAAWPFAWEDPWSRPFDALDEFAKYPFTGTVFYGGQLLKPTDLPLSYIPNLVLRTMPEQVLLGLLLGLIGLVRLRTSYLKENRTVVLGGFVLLLAVILPVGTVWNLGSSLYDSYRHVLFIVPPLVLLAAAGAWSGIRKIGPPLWRRSLVGVFAAAMIMTFCDMISLHPYEYIYFNRSVAGGIRGANRDYDLEYWATALREAAEWVSKSYNPSPGGVVLYSMSEVEPELVDEFMEPGGSTRTQFRLARPGEKPQLAFMIRRYRQTTEPTEGKILHVVARQGVPLVDIVALP